MHLKKILKIFIHIIILEFFNKINYENDYIIYPLDTNKENYCTTKNKKCYFLLKNEYNELSNKILIYGFGKKDISYKVFYMNDSNYYSTDFNLNNLKEIKDIISYNGHLSLDLKTNEKFFLIVIESNSTEEENLSIVSNFYNLSNSPSIDIYSYQLYYLSENISQQFNLIKNLLIKYRILIYNAEGEGYICDNKICDFNNNFIYLKEQKIYSFSISNKNSFYICAKNNIIFNIKIIDEISNEIIKELNYQYNFDNSETFPLIYFIKDVKYNGININFNIKFDNEDNNNLIIKGYVLDYSEISLIKDKKDIKTIDFTNEIFGKYDNITNIGIIELSNDYLKTKHTEEYKYLDDKYFMIIIDNITPFNSNNIKNEIYVFSKDENNILLPINKYIRNSFDLLDNRTIIQKYFFEKEKIINNEFILEFSSNYKYIDLTFNNLTKLSNPIINGGFKQYALSINSESYNDYFFNVVIKSTNESHLDKILKEVNIIIKYYNEKKIININYFYNRTFKLEKINNKEKFYEYNLIINNISEINYSSNSSSDLNYIYYLRLIKKSNILFNEELNTIAQISSNLLYIKEFNTSEPDKKFSFNLKNLENNEVYIALFFIKIENKSEGEERYYSMIYEFNTELEKEQSNSYWIVLIFIIFLIIILFICIIFWRKAIIKNRDLLKKVNEFSFSSDKNEDLFNHRQLSEEIKRNSSNENYFV